MSRWFPDSLRIDFAPDRVVLEQRTADLKLLGAPARRVQRQVLAIGGDARRKGWDDALQALTVALEAYRDVRCTVSVILGSTLVRHALVPQSEGLTAAQEGALLQHCFSEIYGAAAGQWALRLSAAAGMALQPATGVDQALLDALRALFQGRRLRLASIQPRLMAVCNAHRAALRSGPAWLLLVEPGNLCLGLIEGGGFSRLRSQRSGADWAADLDFLLEREACLAELDTAPSEALLWRRDDVPPAAFGDGGLRVQVLPDTLSSADEAPSAALALAAE